MNQNEQNIVQAEFFLTKSDELSDVVKEVFERTMDGVPAIIVVRFRDINGSVTRFTRKLSLLAEASDENIKQSTASRGILRSYHLWRSRKITREHNALEGQRAKVARQGFIQAIVARGEIMIETRPERDFRPIAKNEIHETLEALNNARHAWIFVFPPNKLLDADGVKVRWSA